MNASALHDIGKIAIADNILLKPGRLTEEEFEYMKKHTTYGCEILERFKQEDNEFYRYCFELAKEELFDAIENNLSFADAENI